MGLRKTWETLRHIGMKVTGSLTRPLGRNVENVEYYCQDPDCGKDITRKGGTVVIATSKVYCLEPLPCSRKGQREAMRTGQAARRGYGKAASRNG